MKPRGLALIGSGSIAEQHLKAIREIEGARLVGVYSRTPARAKAAGEREGCPWTTNLEGLLKHPDVEVAVIVTSSGSHAEIGLKALAAGKHVLVEKPMAMSSAEADMMIRMADMRKLTLGVVSQRRFEGQNQAVKKALDGGAIGKLLLVEVSCPYYRTQDYYDSADWRGKVGEDGGALMNQSIHAVDLMLWMAGPAKSVMARIATQTHRMEAEDLALAIVNFASGAFGTIMASTSIQPGFPPCLNLYGEKGSIKIEGAAIVHWTVQGAAKPAGEAQASAGVSDPKLSNHLHHKRQIQDFLEAVESKRAPLVSSADGRRAVELVQGVYRSAASGAAVALGGE